MVTSGPPSAKLCPPWLKSLVTPLKVTFASTTTDKNYQKQLCRKFKWKSSIYTKRKVAVC